VLGIEDGNWKQVRTIRVGLHPSALLASAHGKLLYVANANSDTVSVIDTATDQVIETIPCRPEGRLPFGSGSNALALSPDGATLYVANGTNNCLAVVRLGSKSCEGGKETFGRGEGGVRRPAPSADRGEGGGVRRPAPGAIGQSSAVAGLIPTGWYPGAVVVSPDGKKLFVANVKGHGSLAQKPGQE